MNETEGYIFVCTGPCDQGKKKCPCPESCLLSPRDEHEGFGAAVIPLLLVAAGLLVWLLWSISGYLAK